MNFTWDSIVVGGGAAGLSAALVLGRARRSTLVVDAGGQSNLPAEGVGGLLGHDGRPPAELYALGRLELERYPSVEVRDGAVVNGSRREDGFTLELADGSVEHARRVLLATGMDYRPPTLPGVDERWGRSVFHCPFCHGWEVRERPLGVLGNDAEAATRALLLRAWSDDVTLLANGPIALSDDEAQPLWNAGVPIDQREIAALEGPGDTLTAIRFADGSERACGGLLVPITLHQRSRLAEQLGATTAPPTPLTAEAVAIDPMHGTNVPGLTAAGDLTGTMPSVANAVAAGARAAAMIVHGLTQELGAGDAAGLTGAR